MAGRSRAKEAEAGAAAEMLLVTGGAGFIGSNLVADLNEAGRTDVVVNDMLGSEGKWRNLSKRRIADFVPPADLMRWLDGRKLDAVVHLGAVSDTTAADGDLVLQTNFRLSLALLDWCTATRTSFIYASSAATYGDGRAGFDDDWTPAALGRLRPMNLYGFSKHLFDRALSDRHAQGAELPPQWAGLKFFNVFGPNEYHKGEMMSLIAKRFDAAKVGKPVRLFKSHRDGIGDGEQKRDFIHVDDAVAVMRWLLDSPSVSGIFNVGTGQARSFRDLITAMFCALGRRPSIEYVDMPASIRDQYQYFTQAKVENLLRAGYNSGFTPLEAAVTRYVTSFLDQPDRYR
jgi:ADP-L-glycero-D-manno-heptose 6-epimerase